MSSLSIVVRDYRGCERADVNVSRLALIAGLGGAGKSSFMQAAAAALAQQPLPPEIKKKDAKKLVRGGSDKAKVTVAIGKSVTTVNWPAADLVTDGAPLSVSPYAAGLISVVRLSEKERRAELSRYFKAEPTHDDLKNALGDLKVTPEAIEMIWNKLKVDGWDVTFNHYKDQGAKRKGAWEHVTGENYGSRKSADWVPAEWQESLSLTTQEALEEALKVVQTELEESVRADAVSEEQLRLLRGKAAQVPALEEAAETQRAEAQRLADKVAKLDKAYKALPVPPLVKENPSCPHCGTETAVKDLGGGKYQLVKPEALDAKKLDKMRKALADAKEAVEAAVSESSDAKRVLLLTENDLEGSRKAAASLAQIEKDMAEVTGTAGTDDLRAAVDGAAKRLAMFKARQEASKLNSEIIRIGEIAGVLSPDGLRKRKLTRAVRDVNEGVLKDIFETTGWGRVSFNEDLEAEYNGRPYALVSASERYRVRVALQIVMALLDNSAAILIDDIDRMDPPARNGLFEYLTTLQVPVVVAMMAGAPNVVPDLAAAGIGETYWVTEGNLAPLAAAQRMAAE